MTLQINDQYVNAYVSILQKYDYDMNNNDDNKKFVASFNSTKVRL